MFAVPARDETNGAVVDASAAIADVMAGTDDRWWVVRQVAGTKTGFTTAMPLALPARTLRVVDACQTRLAPSAVREYLDAGALVIMTGSKFMQGAAFSGAVLVPESLVARLREGDEAGAARPLPRGMSDFFSQHEIPSELSHCTPSRDLNAARACTH